MKWLLRIVEVHLFLFAIIAVLATLIEGIKYLIFLIKH